MNNIHLYIGLDGGGSKTYLIAEATDGTTLHLEGPGSNPHRAGFPEAGGILAHLVEEARRAVPSATRVAVCAGVAGAGSVDDQEELASHVHEALTRSEDLSLRVVHDGVIALEGALEDRSGIIVVAGTGSVVFARTTSGAFLRAGGWGYLIGDEGSGHMLGVRGLNAVVNDYDGGPPTHLRHLLADRHGITSSDLLKNRVYNEHWPIQHVAPLVIEAAEAGDDVMQAILAEQTQALARQVGWLVDRADAIAPHLALLGGLSGNAYYRAALSGALLERLPGWHIQEPLHPPAIGALRLAREI